MNKHLKLEKTADHVLVPFNNVERYLYNTAGGMGEEKNWEISNGLQYIYWFINSLHRGRNNTLHIPNFLDYNHLERNYEEPSFPPQHALVKTCLEQIEQEGGIEELETQLINKGLFDDIMNNVKQVKGDIFNMKGFSRALPKKAVAKPAISTSPNAFSYFADYLKRCSGTIVSNSQTQSQQNEVNTCFEQEFKGHLTKLIGYIVNIRQLPLVSQSLSFDASNQIGGMKQMDKDTIDQKKEVQYFTHIISFIMKIDATSQDANVCYR
ncbi:MAG: hypothetical protein EZS28_006479 [Streblomastix strix]|uniref:Uncharacterized protein n=1 Tax=Streblomastix strix TaxID=222440 RepID=A0A5J4WTW1_9EUKA|nr:MAG: hypothetical protein EZS28_006479 [Streblomastix strix]